jgi:hypothetical protein
MCPFYQSRARFAGNPGRTKERRIERLTVNIAPRAAKPKKNPPGCVGGLKSASTA